MKMKLTALLGLTLLFTAFGLKAQDNVQHPQMIATAIAHKVVGPVIDFPALTPEELAEMDLREATIVRNRELAVRNYPFWVAPTTKDAGLQSEMGNTRSITGVIENWAGQNSSSNPPDDNGSVGPNHYMQTINTKYTIYDKTGTQVVAPTNLNTFFSGLPGGTNNDGDPVLLFDEQAQRWMFAEFSGAWSNPDYMLIAVSQTDDPTGLWDAWSFPMNGFPDYMKFGVWQDGYYMGTNTSSGNDIYAFERDVMLAGGASPKMVQFNNPNRPNSGFHCVLPMDNDGAFAPTGTPGGFITINDNSWGGSDQLWVFELDIDWTNTNNSTFTRTQTIGVEPFDSYFGPTWENIRQPGTGQKLDAINQILMHRAQYRNFGTSQTLVVNHTIDVDNTDHAGIRWYELEYTGTEWAIRQFGTYAPDGDSRWMGSIAMNGSHEIGLAYSVSSQTTYPSIRFCGQSAGENALASGVMDIPEESIKEGSASQTSSERWGDYANLAIDPVDDNTFWFTTEYNTSGSQKATRIASFQFTTAPAADFAANELFPGVGDTVVFTDLSSGSPTSWLWAFTPATITYRNGTSETSQNPEVSFDVEGLYSVELTATNAVGPGTTMKTDYINAGGAMMIAVTADPEMVCKGDFVQLNANVSGGTGSYTYVWGSNPFGFNSTIQNPVVIPMVNTTYNVTASDGVQSVNGSVYVTVNNPPVIILGEWPEMMCNVGEPPVQLTAEPVGGTYSGTGVNVTGLFMAQTAEIGWNIITYTYEDANGCESFDQDSIYVDDCVGVGEIAIDETSINLYPNPSMGSITIESENEMERIEIIDQTGKMVLMQKIDGTSAAISSLYAKGLYFVRIYIENANALPSLVTKEFIIK